MLRHRNKVFFSLILDVIFFLFVIPANNSPEGLAIIETSFFVCLTVGKIVLMEVR